MDTPKTKDNQKKGGKDMMEKDQIRMAGHPAPQGVEQYGGLKKAKVVLRINRDIPTVLAERYGIPFSLRIERLTIEDESGKRTYEDIYWKQGTWTDERCTYDISHDAKIANEMIKSIISQYEPKTASNPKVPVEIEIERIYFDWEILRNSEERLWKFEVAITIKYHWENGTKAHKVFIKFPDGEIDAHPLAKIYWDRWITNTVAEFLKNNDIFSPYAYIKEVRI